MKKWIIGGEGHPTTLEMLASLGSSIDPISRDRQTVTFTVVAEGEQQSETLALVITGITSVRGKPGAVQFTATDKKDTKRYCGTFDFQSSGELYALS